MELDVLKEIWNGLDTQIKPQSNDKIIAMLNKPSQSPIAKMKRNLLWEFIFVLVGFGIVIIGYFVAWDGYWNEISWLYIFLALSFTTYFYFKNKLLRQMQCPGCQVKSNLQLQLKSLEKYVRFYVLYGTLLIPFIFLFMVWLFYVKAPLIKHENIFISLLPFVIGTAVITPLIYLLNKWYVNRLYGKHIQRLKAMLNEMSDQ